MVLVKLATGSAILAILGAAVLFNSLVLLTNAIMQAHGRVTRPVVHMFIGGVVKVIVNYVLVGIPEINIIGAPIGTLICYIVIAALNLYAMRNLDGSFRLSPVKSLVKPILAALAMGAAVYGAYFALATYLVSPKLATLGAVVIGVAVYLIFIILLRAITYEDCLLLPKG